MDNQDIMQQFNLGQLDYPSLSMDLLKTQSQVQNQQQNYSEQIQFTQKKKRWTNNLFKSGISFFFRILKLSKNKALNKQLKLFNVNQKKKNKGTFPKLIALAEYFQVLDQTIIEFDQKLPQFLQKKKKKLDQNGYQLLQSIMKEMAGVLACKDWEQGVRYYWGYTTQIAKLQKSLQGIRKFRDQISQQLVFKTKNDLNRLY